MKDMIAWQEGPNDPSCGHLRVNALMEPLKIVKDFESLAYGSLSMIINNLVEVKRSLGYGLNTS